MSRVLTTLYIYNTCVMSTLYNVHIQHVCHEYTVHSVQCRLYSLHIQHMCQEYTEPACYTNNSYVTSTDTCSRAFTAIMSTVKLLQVQRIGYLPGIAQKVFLFVDKGRTSTSYMRDMRGSSKSMACEIYF